MNSPIQPNPKDIIFTLYQDDLDGFAACWALRKLSQTVQVPIEFGTFLKDDDDFSDRNVILLGDAVVHDDGKEFLKKKAKSVLLISKTDSDAFAAGPVKQWERTFPYGVKSLAAAPMRIGKVIDKSLALAAWNYAFADRTAFERLPRLIDQVHDNVSGANKYADSAAVVACLNTYPRTFRNFDDLGHALDDRKRREFLIAGGQAVLRYMTLHPPQEAKNQRLKNLLSELRSKK